MNWFFQSFVGQPTLIERSIKLIGKPNERDPKIIITQFNILPDVNIKEQKFYTKWSYRCDKIKQEILLNNPDIICLQGVDHFKDFFFPHFSSKGYIGYYLEKETFDGINRGGLALFIKKEK